MSRNCDEPSDSDNNNYNNSESITVRNEQNIWLQGGMIIFSGNRNVEREITFSSEIIGHWTHTLIISKPRNMTLFSFPYTLCRHSI